MNKVFAAFLADKSDKNRSRLVQYLAKHPMALCMLSANECATLREAGII